MKATKSTNARKGKAPKVAKVAKVREVSVSFNEFLALRNPSVATKNAIARLARKNLVTVTETSETVLARETKSAIFYKKVVKQNASLTPAGQALVEKLNAQLA
jgi:hypothetical protein